MQFRFPFRLGRVGKANVGCLFIIIAGVGSFVLAKNQVISQRHENMKSRQRMINSNTGEYDSKRNFGPNPTAKQTTS